MKIFNEIEALIKSAKSAKSIGRLSIIDKNLAELAEFKLLRDQFSKDVEDTNAWNTNFKDDPTTTLFCLRLMKKAFAIGRMPSYSWLSNL